MTYALQKIRARLAAAQGNYPVHIDCLGEATPHNPVASRYHCHGCDRDVSCCDVVELPVTAEDYARDVEYLLREVSNNEEAAERAARLRRDTLQHAEHLRATGRSS